MAEKFDRLFSTEAQRVLRLANDEARRMGQTAVGTEHLLLGLIRGSTAAALMLQELGLNPRQVKARIERIASVGRGRVSATQLQLAPQTRQVLQMAIREAEQMGLSQSGPEHLLLAIIRDEHGIASSVLREMGANLEQARRTAAQVAQQTSANPRPARKAREKDTPLIEQLGVDLTTLAEEGKLDPVIGRQKEIERVIQILSRRTKNNPALIGEPGVGKTAIVEGLAQRIVAGKTPGPLLKRRVVQLDVGSLVAGTMYRGQFEERLKKVIHEIRDSRHILFIDELHMLVGAGAAGSQVDAANILKPALARGELQCIGATTSQEYRKHIESDAALERRFQPVTVEEPTVDETIAILRGIRERYEEHHRVDITDDAIEAAAQLGARYISDRYLPDKAIDLIDEAASRTRMYKSLEGRLPSGAVPEEAQPPTLDPEHWKEARSLHDLEQAGETSEQLNLGWPGHRKRPKVTAEDIAEMVSMWTGIPIARLATEESERLLHMEEALHQRIVGQDEPISIIARAVRRARAGLKDPKRPIGSFIFLGPTGVGKTELAKALAEFMFGSEDSLMQLDMSEFMERHTVSRLVGAPPGYIGYEEAGQLTESVRRRPYSVVLFDEVEKAHPEAFNMLLQIMEDGHLSDAKGRKVDFRNTIIIMTSNVGAEQLARESMLGFQVPRDEAKTEEDEYERMREKVLDQLKRTFRPEFLNRVDAVVVFRSLNKTQIRQIVDLELDKVRQRLADHRLALEVTDEAKSFLAERGYEPQFGARPLRRVIQQMVEDALSEGLLAGEFQEGDTVLVDAADDNIVLETALREGEMEASSPVKP